MEVHSWIGAYWPLILKEKEIAGREGDMEWSWWTKGGRPKFFEIMSHTEN